MSEKIAMRVYFVEPLWRNNQIVVAILGICSALAVTTSMGPAITMALAVSFVTGCSSALVSLLRKFTPDSVRMITQLVVISLFVTVVDLFLKAYAYTISKTLSVFVGLIITNCIVMGRAESMAKNVSPLPALLDGLAAGIGYGVVLCTVAGIREVLGAGTLFGYQMVPESWCASDQYPQGYQNLNLMSLAPGAFFLLAGLVWITNLSKGEKGK